MHSKKITIHNQRALICGPIYNKVNKLSAIKELSNSEDIIIFLGDSTYPYNSTTEAIGRLENLRSFFEERTCYYILGNYDLSFKTKIRSSNADYFQWLESQYSFIEVEFNNNSKFLILHGGLLPRHKTLQDLENDPEVSFVNNDWHKGYKGHLGYIVSSHGNHSSETIEIYNHSVSLETNCHLTNILAVQEVTKSGLGKTIYL